MKDSKAFVLVGSPSDRETITSLLTTNDTPVVDLATRQQLYDHLSKGARGCLIVGDDLGGKISGCDVIRQHSNSDRALPSILVSANPDMQLAISAFRAGVIEFLARPFESTLLLSAVQRGFRQDDRLAEIRGAQERFHNVTDDEHRVISLMLDGVSNRRIASRLDIGVRTVERLRSRILSKVGATTPVEVAKLHTLAFGGVARFQLDSFPTHVYLSRLPHR